MRRTHFAVAFLLLLPLVAWLGRVVYFSYSGQLASRPSIHSAEGYARTVNLFLTHRWLSYDVGREEIVTHFSESSAMDRFYRDSYLERDVRAFNNGDRTIFHVANGQLLSLDRNVHNIVLPFVEERAWPGTLTFRPELHRWAELRGRNAQLQLIGPTVGLRQLHRFPEALLVPATEEQPAVSVRGDAINIFTTGGLHLAKTHLLGPSIIINHRTESTRVTTSINGEPVALGNRSRMDNGDLLKLEWRTKGSRGRYALLWSTISGEAAPISSYRWVNGVWKRTPEAPQPTLGRDVVRALDRAFQRRDPEGELEIRPVQRRERFDLALTLHSRLQSEIQRRLAAYCQTLRDPQEPPFRAAVTVMDSLTGELLALASYPTSEDLDDEAAGGLSRNRLLRNHNFSRLPIGSVAKVMLAAAILDATPELADLKIRPYPGEEVEQLLGIELDPVLKDLGNFGGGDGWVDLEDFIETSSNKYGIALLTLATGVDLENRRLRGPEIAPEVANQLAPEEVFAIGDRVYDRRPKLDLPLRPSREDEELARVGTITTLEFSPHAARLDELFDVDISRKVLDSDTAGLDPRRQPWEGDDLVDTDLWLPLLEHLYTRAKIPLSHTFYGVSPERENLAYNLVNNYRTQFLSVILGGASSTWTNIKVSEAFSRLVTGREIGAQLVRRVKRWEGGELVEERPESEAPELPMDPEIRQRLVDAMGLVSGPRGTAKSLNGRLREYAARLEAEGKALGFFSKTGSPTNLTFVPTRTATAINSLIQAGALRLEHGDLIVYRESGPVRLAPPEGQRISPSLKALQSHEGDMRILRNARVHPRSIIRVCSTFNSGDEEIRRDLFDIRSGKLVGMLSSRRVSSIGGAYAFVLGVYDGAARRSGGSVTKVDVVDQLPERALTVTISLESQGTGPRVAVPFAGELIDGVLWDALQEGW